VLLDTEGDEIQNTQTYIAYALVVDKTDASRAILSKPSKPLRLKDERVLDIYALTSHIKNYNPYLLFEKPSKVENLPASVDLTFDSNDILLVLTKSEGLLEYRPSGLDTLIPSIAFADPKVVRIGPEGFIYIIDGTSILKYERDGTFVETFLKDLIAPSSIAWDHLRQFYITEKIPDGRVLTYNKSKEIIHSFFFNTGLITPKAVIYNRPLKQIFINRTSRRGTAIVALDPETQDWTLLGALQFYGKWSDTFTTNAAGHTVIVRVDGKEGPEICVVENKLNQDLDIIAISPPLDSLPVSILMGPVQ
jgi:hypothetical protein